MNGSARTLLAVGPAVFALAATLGGGPALAAEPGRLFFSREERVELEKKRFAPPAPARPVEQSANPAAPPAPPAPEFTTINGQVTQSSGRTTTWVNGVPVYDKFRSGTDTVRVPVASSRAGTPVKVGQTVESLSGAKSDPLAGGSIRIRPAQP